MQRAEVRAQCALAFSERSGLKFLPQTRQRPLDAGAIVLIFEVTAD